jgi:hypothetical protein
MNADCIEYNSKSARATIYNFVARIIFYGRSRTAQVSDEDLLGEVTTMICRCRSGSFWVLLGRLWRAGKAALSQQCPDLTRLEQVDAAIRGTKDNQVAPPVALTLFL